MTFPDWIALASVIVIALAAYFPLRYTARKDEREQERANQHATRQAVADARAEFDRSKAELISDRDYWRALANERQAQINDLLNDRQNWYGDRRRHHDD